MLKVDISDGNSDGSCSVHVMASGDLGTQINNVCLVVNGIYSRLKCSAEPGLADDFRLALLMVLLDPVHGPFSRVNAGNDKSVTVISPVVRGGDSNG